MEVKIGCEFPMKGTAMVLCTIANLKADPSRAKAQVLAKCPILPIWGCMEPGVRANWSWQWP